MDDLISRNAAIDTLRMDISIIPFAKAREYVRATIEEIYNRLEALPSAQPERKRGKWIPVTNGRGGHECDQCHSYAPAFQTGKERLTDYCPTCGTKMEGGDSMDAASRAVP